MSPENSITGLGPPADPSVGPSEEATAERLAKETDGILKRLERARQKSWQDWMAIAERLAGISEVAQHLTGANSRAGKPYAGMMSQLLHKHQLGDKKWKQTRAALLNIWENRAAVEAMRETWRKGGERDEVFRWQAPTTVWDKFSKRQKAEDPKQAQAQKPSSANAKLIELQDEIDRLRRYSIVDLDAAEVVLLIVELFEVEARDEIIEGLAASRDQPAKPRRAPRPRVADGWPVTALRANSADEAGDDDDDDDEAV